MRNLVRIVLVFVLLHRAELNSRVIERKVSGDYSLGLTHCNGTLVVRNDNTRTIQCHMKMNEQDADCDLFLDGSRSFGVIQENETKSRHLEITKSQPLLTSFCSANYKPHVGTVQLQDYPNSYKEPIWDEEIAEKVKRTLEYNSDERGEKLTIKLWDFFAGELVRLYVECRSENGTRESSQQSKQCILFKYVGTGKLPLTDTNFVNIATAPTIAPTNGSITTQPANQNKTTRTIETTKTTTTIKVTGNKTPEAAPRETKEEIPWLIIGLSVGLSLLLVIIINLIVWLLCKKRRNAKKKSELKNNESIAMKENVSYRDNPTFTSVEIKKPPESYNSEKKSSQVKGTGTIDTDGKHVTSSAYVFLGKDKKAASTGQLDTVHIKIPLQES